MNRSTRYVVDVIVLQVEQVRLFLHFALPNPYVRPVPGTSPLASTARDNNGNQTPSSSMPPSTGHQATQPPAAERPAAAPREETPRPPPPDVSSPQTPSTTPRDALRSARCPTYVGNDRHRRQQPACLRPSCGLPVSGTLTAWARFNAATTTPRRTAPHHHCIVQDAHMVDLIATRKV